jgi:hypothetical protein
MTAVAAAAAAVYRAGLQQWAWTIIVAALQCAPAHCLSLILPRPEQTQPQPHSAPCGHLNCGLAGCASSLLLPHLTPARADTAATTQRTVRSFELRPCRVRQLPASLSSYPGQSRHGANHSAHRVVI